MIVKPPPHDTVQGDSWYKREAEGGEEEGRGEEKKARKAREEEKEKNIYILITFFTNINIC